MKSTVPDAIRAWRWRIFAATWASYAGYYFCRKPFYMAKGALTTELGWTPEVLANIGAVYLVSYMLGQFLAGWLGTRWGPRVCLLGGMGISIGCNLAFGFVHAPMAFGALMAMNGLAQASGWSNNVGTMSQWYGRTERGTIMGLWGTNFQFGGIAANTLAAWAGEALGYRWAFFTGSVVLATAWAIVLFWQRDRPEDAGLPPMPSDLPLDVHGVPEVDSGWTRQILVNTLIIGVFYFFVKFIRYALWSWAPYILEHSYGLRGDEAGYVSTAFDAAGLASVIAIGWLSDRFFGGRRVGIAVLFLVGMVLATALLYQSVNTGVVAFAVAIALIGFFLFGPDALMSGVGAMDVGSRKTAVAATGIINGMGSAGAVVQEFVFGSFLTPASGAASAGAADPMTAAFGTLIASALLATLCLSVLFLRGRMGKSRV